MTIIEPIKDLKFKFQVKMLKMDPLWFLNQNNHFLQYRMVTLMPLLNDTSLIFWYMEDHFFRHTILHLEDCPKPLPFFLNPAFSNVIH